MLKKIDITYLYPIILGLSISFFISSIFYYKYNSLSLHNQPKVQDKKRINENKVDLDFILKTNMFAIQIEKEKVKPVTIKKEKKEEPIEVVSTNFEGKLIGIITGKENMALISFHNKLLLLKLNVEVEGVKLRKISSNEIIISYKGKNYKLILEENKKFKISKPIKQITSKTEKIKIKKAQAIKQLKDINRFMRDVVIFPFYDKSVFKGYRISRIAPNSILKTAGLKPGDIIVRINGEDLKNPQRLMEIFSKINDLTAISIDIIRNGTNRSLFIELED